MDVKPFLCFLFAVVLMFFSLSKKAVCLFLIQLRERTSQEDERAAWTCGEEQSLGQGLYHLVIGQTKQEDIFFLLGCLTMHQVSGGSEKFTVSNYQFVMSCDDKQSCRSLLIGKKFWISLHATRNSPVVLPTPGVYNSLQRDQHAGKTMLNFLEDYIYIIRVWHAPIQIALGFEINTRIHLGWLDCMKILARWFVFALIWNLQMFGR